MKSLSSILTKEARLKGLSLVEPDDDILELRQNNKVIARFSQTGVVIENTAYEIAKIMEGKDAGRD